MHIQMGCSATKSNFISSYEMIILVPLYKQISYSIFRLVFNDETNFEWYPQADHVRFFGCAGFGERRGVCLRTKVCRARKCPFNCYPTRIPCMIHNFDSSHRFFFDKISVNNTSWRLVWFSFIEPNHIHYFIVQL